MTATLARLSTWFVSVAKSSLSICSCTFSCGLVGGILLDIKNGTVSDSTVFLTKTFSILSPLIVSNDATTVRLSATLFANAIVILENLTCFGGYTAIAIEGSSLVHSSVSMISSGLRLSSIPILLNTVELIESTLLVTNTQLVARLQTITMHVVSLRQFSLVNVTLRETTHSLVLLDDVTSDQSTMVMTLTLNSSLFVGQPLTVVTVKLCNASVWEFDMSESNWTRSQTFNSYLVGMLDVLLADASMGSIRYHPSSKEREPKLDRTPQRHRFIFLDLWLTMDLFLMYMEAQTDLT